MANHKGNNDAVKGAHEEAVERRPESLRLRIAGASFRQIGEQLGISHEQARQDVKAALRATLDAVKEEADEYRELELERLDILWSRYFPLAVNKKNPDTNAAYRCIQISKRRCELMGIDAPQKHAITDTKGNDLGVIAIPEERKNGTNGKAHRLETAGRKADRSSND